MLCRLFAILPIFGILYCPLACLGTGMVLAQPAAIQHVPAGCGCCKHETSASGESLPVHEHPGAPDDNCHQCVCNVVVEAAAKPLAFSATQNLPADWALPRSQNRPSLLAVHPAAALRNTPHPDQCTGIAVRLLLGSLVI